MFDAIVHGSAVRNMNCPCAYLSLELLDREATILLGECFLAQVEAI